MIVMRTFTLLSCEPPQRARLTYEHGKAPSHDDALHDSPTGTRVPMTGASIMLGHDQLMQGSAMIRNRMEARVVLIRCVQELVFANPQAKLIEPTSDVKFAPGKTPNPPDVCS